MKQINIYHEFLILCQLYIGPREACSKCTELVILKLHEDSSIKYANKSTSYGRTFDMRPDMQSNQMPPSAHMNLPQGAETISATTTITMNGIAFNKILMSGITCIFFLTVPDTIIGFVLGKRGSVIAEIQKMSGAKVVVSPR